MRTFRRLASAAAVSGVVHAAVIAFGRVDLPEPPGALPPLAVRIVNSAPAAQPIVEASVQPPGRARVKPRWALFQTVNASSPSVIPVEPDADNVASVEASAEEPSAPLASTEPALVATAPPSIQAPDPPPLRSLPRKGRITYDLVYGRDQFPVGRTVQTWEMDGTRYHLASRSETTGIVDLFRSQHRTFLSSGSLTPDGLRPDIFRMTRNRGRRTEETRARFDWDGASVVLEAATGERQQSLPAHTQDLLSFMYQLSIAPPLPGRFRQSLTNGARLETYEVDVLPEETIETPLGPLRALPVRQLRKEGAESLELWLATEYRYLPVRIRFFSREGEPQGEQIVTEIRLSED